MNGSRTASWWRSRRRMASPASQNGSPPLSDVSAGGVDGERRPRLSRAAPGFRDIGGTNEYQACLP